jgi:hypothetical protein
MRVVTVVYRILMRFVCKACGKRGADVRQDWQSVESQFPALATM